MSSHARRSGTARVRRRFDTHSGDAVRQQASDDGQVTPRLTLASWQQIVSWLKRSHSPLPTCTDAGAGRPNQIHAM